MAESAGTSAVIAHDENENKENKDVNYEPEAKRSKKELCHKDQDNKLEDRLSGILCCAVCLDLPRTCYQCGNGHLMCAGCFNHLLADARLKDETSTCPNCRCEISKTTCSRNLAVEKAISELPAECQYCACQLPRNLLEFHEKTQCQERPCTCEYARIGCPWRGPYHELLRHQETCTHPEKSGREIMAALHSIDKAKEEQMRLYDSIFSLLSFEKVTFNDLQLRPYRTDDFITKLFYETSRFSAFNQQWVIKARVNTDHKDPTHTCYRNLTYQLVSKSRPTTPVSLHYLALKGPYGEMNVRPVIYSHDFSNESLETEYHELPVDSHECNKLLAAKTINLRLILFLVQQ